MTKRFASLALAAVALGASIASTAQDKLDRPLRILVGFAAGGTADLMARLVADKMKDTIGQTILVENRPGAAGRVAADAVKIAPADGATIMVMPIGPMAVVPHTTKLLSSTGISTRRCVHPMSSPSFAAWVWSPQPARQTISTAASLPITHAGAAS